MIFIKKDLIWNNRTNTIYNDTKDYNRFQQKAKLKQLKKKLSEIPQFHLSEEKGNMPDTSKLDFIYNRTPITYLQIVFLHSTLLATAWRHFIKVC